jgi:D-arabinose 1-dehydrogenase-like Zn-dependent alcohol dehydrogenase
MCDYGHQKYIGDKFGVEDILTISINLITIQAEVTSYFTPRIGLRTSTNTMDSIQALPTTQTAIVAGPNGEFEVAFDHPVTPLGDEEVIVKTVAVALNPVDTKLIGPFITPKAIFGYDLAGFIVAVGKSDPYGFKVGDRVCGSARGMNPDKPLGGAFAEYVSLPADLTLRMPDHMSFEEAASLGTAIASACLSLFWTAKIPASIKEPATKPFPVLVYGGSTASGTMLLQMLKMYAKLPLPSPEERLTMSADVVLALSQHVRPRTLSL